MTFEKPVAEITRFDLKDVISSSGDNGRADNWVSDDYVCDGTQHDFGSDDEICIEA